MVDGKSYSYCILDEGHAIRNPKARITQAVKKVRAEHRLLLSGTPIQNDVVELWSLFDFLMPGFLGTEREFKQSYGIASARSVAAKKGGGLTEQGALATGKLHKQVMPFVLRRTKDEVLKDLPQDNSGHLRRPHPTPEAPVRRIRGILSKCRDH